MLKKAGNMNRQFTRTKYKNRTLLATGNFMRTPRTNRGQKAISPIIATLILIILVAVAVALTEPWVIASIKDARTQTNVTLKNGNVNFTATTTQVTISNSGTEKTQIERIYIGTFSNNMTDITASSDIGSNKTLNGTSSTTITINWPNSMAGSWVSGQTYYFKVVPNPGPYALFTQKAP
jgi:hypothetical protein